MGMPISVSDAVPIEQAPVPAPVAQESEPTSDL